MRVADVLRELGRPIAYYPFLSRYLGGVNASVLFCQIFYWQDKATSELGVHKTVEELEEETGLSYEEQRAARAKLRACGVLIETAKRIEHRTYFRIDEDVLEHLLESPPPPKAPRKSPSPRMGKPHLPKWEKSISGDGKSPSREVDKPEAANKEKPTPRDGENHARGNGNSHPVNGTETTAEITSETTAAAARARPPVDNSELPPLLPEGEKAHEPPAPADDVAPPGAEEQLLAVLESLPNCGIDPQTDRVDVLVWVGKGVTPEQLAEAYKRALARRASDNDDRPIYAKFLARFVDEMLAERGTGARAAGGEDERPAQWWLSDSGIGGQGKRVRVERRPNESTPEYLVRVAKDSGPGPWIDYAIKQWRGTGRYQAVVEFLGDLLPSDFGV